MFIFFIMRHHHLTFETVEHYKIFTVAGIFLSHNCTWSEKIRSRNFHTFQKRPYPQNYFLQIIYYTSHSEIYLYSYLQLKMPAHKNYKGHNQYINKIDR